MPSYVEGFSVDPNPSIPFDSFIAYLTRREGDEFLPNSGGPARHIYLAPYKSVSSPPRDLLAGAVYSPSARRVHSRAVHDKSNKNKLTEVMVDELRDNESVGDSSFFLLETYLGERRGLYLHPSGALGVQGLVRLLNHAFTSLKNELKATELAAAGADETSINKKYTRGLGAAMVALPENWRDAVEELEEANRIRINLKVPIVNPGPNSPPTKVKSFCLDYGLRDTSGEEAAGIVAWALQLLGPAVGNMIKAKSIQTGEVPSDNPAELLRQARGDITVRSSGRRIPISVKRTEQMVRFREVSPSEIDSFVRSTSYTDLGNSPAFSFLEEIMNGSSHFAR
jgi:hypothetical protein